MLIIPSPLFVSPERSSERDYVITDSVVLYVVCVCIPGGGALHDEPAACACQ